MKKKILLKALIPLTAVGVTLGATLPIASCSCNNNDNQPLPTATLTIDSTSFSRYLVGASPNVTGYTSEFTDFFNHHNVDRIVFDIDNITIAGNVFLNCVALSNSSKSIAIEFTSPQISVGRSAFYGCAGISQIICSSTTSPTISFSNNGASFTGCSNLTGFSRNGHTSVITLASIVNSNFYGCTNLKVEEIDDDILNVANCTWTNGNDANSGYWLETGKNLYNSGCIAVGTITCPFASIDATAFNGCASLTEITNLPGGTINAGAFQDCTSLVDVKFATGGTTVNFIDVAAFRKCVALNNIHLSALGWTGGSSVSNIGNNAFADCGLNGGTIIGTGAQNLLHAIQTKDPSWLPNWTAIEQP